MKDSQKAVRSSVGGCDTMKCNWFDGLAIFSSAGHLIDYG